MIEERQPWHSLEHFDLYTTFMDIVASNALWDQISLISPVKSKKKTRIVNKSPNLPQLGPPVPSSIALSKPNEEP